MKCVLFVCNHDAGRSQMAQAFFGRDAPEGVRARIGRLGPGGGGPARGDRGDAGGRDRPGWTQAAQAGVLARHDGVPIRGHIMTPAHKRAAECPHAERFAALDHAVA